MFGIPSGSAPISNARGGSGAASASIPGVPATVGTVSTRGIIGSIPGLTPGLDIRTSSALRAPRGGVALRCPGRRLCDDLDDPMDSDSDVDSEPGDDARDDAGEDGGVDAADCDDDGEKEDVEAGDGGWERTDDGDTPAATALRNGSFLALSAMLFVNLMLDWSAVLMCSLTDCPTLFNGDQFAHFSSFAVSG